MAGIVRAAVEAGPAVRSRAADIVRVAAGPVVEATVPEEAGRVVEAIARAEADPAVDRADSDEAGRATIAAERFAASAWTRSNT